MSYIPGSSEPRHEPLGPAAYVPSPADPSSWVPVPPPKRKSRVPIAIGLALAAIALGTGSFFVANGVFGHNKVLPAPSPTTASIPPPPAGALDDRSECTLLIPILQDAADEVNAIAAHPDGSTVDRAKLAKTIADLQTMWTPASAAMRADIDQQIAPLKDLQAVMQGQGNRTLSFENFRASGLRIVARCQQYAN